MSLTPADTKVCVLGLGYIGLPTASVLATKGFQVTGVDVRREVVQTIQQGKIHIQEPDLDILVRSAVNSGQLQAALEPQASDVFIICVPTPIREDETPDLSFIEQACDTIRPYVTKGALVILESTSPPGTTQRIVAQRAIPDELVVGKDVFVAHCPERVLPGRILLELVQNDRVVGGVTQECGSRAKEFYASFVSGEVFVTSAATAETTKLIENAYRDVNIAFANEVSMLANELDIDPWETIALANRHPRVDILSPGPGVGGHCISVDPWFLVDAAPESTPLIRTARQVNKAKPYYIVEQVKRLARQFASPDIGCFGLAYKADVDDMRESPAVEVVRELVNFPELGKLHICDPHVKAEQVCGLPLCSMDDVLRQCQVLVFLTAHQQFKEIPRTVLDGRAVLDACGVFR